MAKWGKKLLGLAAIGGAAAGLVYYLKSKEELDLDVLVHGEPEVSTQWLMAMEDLSMS